MRAASHAAILARREVRVNPYLGGRGIGRTVDAVRVRLLRWLGAWLGDRPDVDELLRGVDRELARGAR